MQAQGVRLILASAYYEPRHAQFVAQHTGATVKARQEADAFERRGVENWAGWWQALAAEPACKELLAERERRFAWRVADPHRPLYDVHEAALCDAGFREVGVIWQRMCNRVLMAVR